MKYDFTLSKCKKTVKDEKSCSSFGKIEII